MDMDITITIVCMLLGREAFFRLAGTPWQTRSTVRLTHKFSRMVWSTSDEPQPPRIRACNC